MATTSPRSAAAKAPRVLVLVALTLAAPPWHSDACADDAALAVAGSEAANDAQIAAWIEQLDAPRFSVRQRAETQLQAAGTAALPAVSAAARDDSLERSSRAVRILLSWSETGPSHDRLAALEQLALATDTHPTESAFAADQFATVREAAALEALVELGAIHNVDQLAVINRRNAVLQVIIGPQWTGGDEGLKLLGDLRHIRTLSFHSAPISDQGLLTVASLTSVERMEIYQTPRPSAETIEALQAAHPECDLAVRSGAQLGIQGQADPGGQPNAAFVQAVFPDTAAARAGIRAGDLITEVGDTEIESFVALTEAIAAYQPGDTVEMTIKRQGELIRLPVTFDRWGENETFNQASLGNIERRIQVQGGGQVIINGNRRVFVPTPQQQAPPQPAAQPQQPANPPQQPEQQKPAR